jgi:ribonucleoside-triphosphate reductase
VTIPSELPTDYQNFIHKTRYARFRDDLGRRENWDETVTRYFDHFEADLERRHGYKVPATLRSELEDAVGNLHIMPSMRALMTAGPALERENIAGYNCAYLAIDRIRAFAEALYILMCGTGVGFSVERQEIKKLPEVPHDFSDSDRVIVVGDSKLGWSQAFDDLVHSLYAGVVPKIDYSEIRPAGARLIIFGGRASGPDPLRSLFEFTIRMFKNAAGRRLNSLECHEIVCKVGDIVVVGGVRRSALISLSNLSDLRMRDAKSGNWYETKGHLRLANNSVAYTEKPEVGPFMAEWMALYNSKSGERGIFNRYGAEQKIQRLGRREHGYSWGTNPCGEIVLRSRQLCNLSETIVRPGDNMASLKDKARLASVLGTWQSTQTTFNFVEPEWQINSEAERLLGVSMTGIYDNAMTRGDSGLDVLAKNLQTLKAAAIQSNRVNAKAIGINASAAVTTVKPSGTVSELVQARSGIHAGKADHSIRHVRQDNKDPVTTFMADAGFPNEPDNMALQTTTVFAFPTEQPPGVPVEADITAVQQLALVQVYNHNWTEHAVSCTISVREHEWPAVGGWVYDHFDDVAGLSFLPFFEEDTTYTQLPRQTITKAQYDEMLAGMPKGINWGDLSFYENGVDTVTGTREFACVGNSCEVVGSAAA